MVIIISKSKFGSISIDRISTGSSFGTFCSLRSKLNSDDHNTLDVFYVIAPRLTWATKCGTAHGNLSRVDRISTGYFNGFVVTLNKITLH